MSLRRLVRRRPAGDQRPALGEDSGKAGQRVWAACNAGFARVEGGPKPV